MAAWKNDGRLQDAARASRRMGLVYEELGRLQESLHASEEALTLIKATRDQLLESDIDSDVGAGYARVGVMDAASSHCRTALSLAEQRHAIRQTARAFNCLGDVEYHRGDSREALPLYQRAQALWVTVGDERGLADTLLSIGSSYSDLNDLDRAGEHLRLAQKKWAELGDRRGQALTDLALARLQYIPGEYQEALNRLTHLRDRFHIAGDVVWEAACLSNIAYVYEQMGENRDALRYWESASELFQAAGLQMAALETSIKIGTGYLDVDIPRASSWFEKALALSDASGNLHMRSWALRYIGTAHLAENDYTEALRYLEQSLNMQGTVTDPRFRARTLVDIGKAYASLGDRARAISSFREALERSGASKDRVGEAMAVFGLAQTAAAAGKLNAARDYAESALNLAESLRTKVEDRDLRASYFASVHPYHELYVDVLMRLNKRNTANGLASAAFEAAERARARSLLESLTDAKVDFRRGVDAGLLERERMLQKQFDDWAQTQRVQTGGSVANNRTLNDQYRTLEDQFNQIQAEIRSKSPHYAGLARPQPVTLKAARKLLDDKTLLLEYALGDERSYLWTVTTDGPAAYTLPARRDIEPTAHRVYERLRARGALAANQTHDAADVNGDETEYWRDAASLSNMILGPVAAILGHKRILVVADGALEYVPFAALPVPRRAEPVPMIVEHEIVNLPSASVLAVLRSETRDRKMPGKAVAVLADPVFDSGDPRLRAVSSPTSSSRMTSAKNGGEKAAPSLRAVGALASFVHDGRLTIPRLASTRQEADAIAEAAANGTTLSATDFAASRTTAMSPQLSDYRILHFATHGVFNNDDPALSGIVLSMFDDRGQPQDGVLRLHDIYNLDLPAELVVLSACETALGKPVRGEGLVGIVRGFMYAGAKRVVASLWKVDDEATVELMGRFYTQIFRQERSPAAALRQAQLAMWQQPKWRSPFYWAAFVLQGEWK